MRWERMLTTGASLVVSGRQIILSQPSPQWAMAEDVSWWSNEQISRYLETFAIGGFTRAGADGELLAERLYGRVPQPWATLLLAAGASAGSVGIELDEFVSLCPVRAPRSAMRVVRSGEGEVSLFRGDAVVGAVRDKPEGTQVHLSSDRPDAALLLFGALLFACRETGCRQASASLRMHSGSEHECNPTRDAFAARTQLEMLGVRLPLDAALAWFPVHKLAITGDLRTTSEGAIVIDF